MAEKVEQRAYHGELNPSDLARALVVRFDTGETRAYWMEADGGRAVVQVQNRRVEPGDPNTAITVQVVPTKTGLTVAVSEQKLLGVAADMAKTGVNAWFNPMRLLGELDDIARNVRLLGLRPEVWKAVDEYCQAQGSGRGSAGILDHIECPYCGTPNEIGTRKCVSCQAPLAQVQPIICGHCGVMNRPEATLCVNCGKKL